MAVTSTTPSGVLVAVIGCGGGGVGGEGVLAGDRSGTEVPVPGTERVGPALGARAAVIPTT
jgi:hypothetical protein